MDHKTVSLADRVFERLEADILTGIYKRGQLLTELSLVEDLGVSRTPIREAVRRLEMEHLVEATPRGIAVIGIGEGDLADIYEIRLRLEGYVAALAARGVTEARLAELRDAVEMQEFYVTRHDADHIRTLDSEFHEIVYRLADSTVLYDTLLPLHRKVQKYRKVSVQDDNRAEHSLIEHQRIYEAIAAGDAVLAEKYMNEHIKNARDHILKRG